MNYNFDEYKRHNVQGLLKGAWEIAVPAIEHKAKNDFEHINNDELRQYLFLIIEDCYNNRIKLVDEVYNKRIKYLKSRFTLKKHFNISKDEWEVTIIKNYNSDFYFYKYAIIESKTLNIQDQNILNFITDKALNAIENVRYYIDKLIFITDFKENLENSIVKVGLFEKVNQEDIVYFKDIFINYIKYKKVIESLIEKKIIKENPEGNFILLNDNIGELKPNKLLAALAYLLHKYNYLNTDVNARIYGALKVSFNYMPSERTLLNSFKSFDNLNDLNTSDYINHFHMIKPLDN